MSQKSDVMPFNMVFKNEAKYEDCFEILDTYESSTQSAYRQAFGKLESLAINSQDR